MILGFATVAPCLLLAASALLVPPAHRPVRRPWLPATIPGTMWLVGSAATIAALWIAGIGGAIASAAVAGTALARHRQQLQRQREVREGANWATAIETLLAFVRIGVHPAEATGFAAHESRGAPKQLFSAVSARITLGSKASDAFYDCARRSDMQVIAVPARRLAAVWRINEEFGIAMTNLLGAIHAEIVSRQQADEELDAELAGARTTASVLAALPAVGLLLGTGTGAQPLRVLTSGGLGGALLAGGVALTCAGLLWADAITERARG